MRRWSVHSLVRKSWRRKSPLVDCSEVSVLGSKGLFFFQVSGQVRVSFVLDEDLLAWVLCTESLQVDQIIYNAGFVRPFWLFLWYVVVWHRLGSVRGQRHRVDHSRRSHSHNFPNMLRVLLGCAYFLVLYDSFVISLILLISTIRIFSTYGKYF